MPQTTINRRCGCKGSDAGVWVVHCGASAVKPGDCKVTTDCTGTCEPANDGKSAKFKPDKKMKKTQLKKEMKNPQLRSIIKKSIRELMEEDTIDPNWDGLGCCRKCMALRGDIDKCRCCTHPKPDTGLNIGEDTNMLNEVQCPCFAGNQPLTCVDSYNNLQQLVGCCNGKGSQSDPLHVTCDGLSCGTIMDGNATDCWTYSVGFDPGTKPTKHASDNLSTTPAIYTGVDNVSSRDMRDKRPSIDNMMYEASMNILCEREGQDDGEVEVYRATNQDTKETINVDRNHEMWSEVIDALSKGTPRKVKQLTKGKGDGKLNLNEGILCCWLRGGCCVWEQNIGSYHDSRASWTIVWDGCCGNSSKGGCC